jgi:hypothetical protein
MQFNQIQYSEKIKERIDKSFSKIFSEAEVIVLETVIDVWQDYGKNMPEVIVTRNKQLQTFIENFSIKPGETLPVFQLPNGECICGIEVTPSVPLNSRFKNLILRAKWEEESVPAINSPFTDFLGYAFGKPSVKSLLLGVRNNIHYCYLPMPFDKKVTLELEFLQSPLNMVAEIPVNVTIYYSEKKRMDNEGKFYAKREKNPEMGRPY